jgi:hypothetical protein
MDSLEEGWSRRSVLGGVAATMVTGTGCLAGALSPQSKPSDWPQRGFDAGHTNYKTEGSPPLDGVRVDWQAESVAAFVDSRYLADSIWGAGVVVGDGTVVTRRGTTIALADGRVKQRSTCLDVGGARPQLAGFARTEPYANGVVLSRYLDRDGTASEFDGPRLYGLRPSMADSGQCEIARRWTAGSPRDVSLRRAGAIEDGTILAAGSALAAIDADDGSVQWRADDVSDVENFCTDGDQVFVAQRPFDAADALAIIERDTGRPVNHYRIDTSDRLVAAREDRAYLRTSNDAIETDLEDGRSPTARLLAVEGTAGERDWKADLAAGSDFGAEIRGIGAIAVGPESVFVPVQGDGGDTRCLALDARDGTVRWSKAVSAGPWVVATDQAVYLSGGKVACLDSATGEVRWMWSPSSSNARGPPVIADKRLLVPTNNALYALEET